MYFILNLDYVFGFFFQVWGLGFYCFLASFFNLNYKFRLRLVGIILLAIGSFFLIPIPVVWEVYWDPYIRQASLWLDVSLFISKTLEFYADFASFNLVLRLIWIWLILYIGVSTYKLSSKSWLFTIRLLAFLTYFLLYGMLDVTLFTQKLLTGLQYVMYLLYMSSKARQAQEVLWDQQEISSEEFCFPKLKESYNLAKKKNQNSKTKISCFYFWVVWGGFAFIGACSKYFVKIGIVICFLLTVFVGSRAFFDFHYIFSFLFGIILAIHSLSYDTVWYTNYKKVMGKKVLILLTCNSPADLRRRLFSSRARREAVTRIVRIL